MEQEWRETSLLRPGCLLRAGSTWHFCRLGEVSLQRFTWGEQQGLLLIGPGSLVYLSLHGRGHSTEFWKLAEVLGYGHLHLSSPLLVWDAKSSHDRFGKDLRSL